MKSEIRNTKYETISKFEFRALLGVLILAMAFVTPIGQVAQAATNSSSFTTSLTTTGVSSAPPSVPTNLVATPISDTEIDLSWTASISGGVYPIAGYRIFRDSVFLATTSATVYADLGLIASTTYSYAVEAFDTNIQLSGQTAPVATTTLQTPVPTPTPTPAPVSNGTTGSGGSSGTQLLIYSTSIVPTQTDATVSFTTSMPAESKILWGKTSDYEAGSLSELIYGTSHELHITGLEAGNDYVLLIQATGNTGTTVSAAASFRTLAGAPGATIAPLANPSNFKATPGTNDINLTWRNPSDDRFDGVRVVRSETFFPGDQFDGVPVYEGNGQSFTDTNIVVGKIYYYAIFAKGKDGDFSSGALAKSRIAPAGEIILGGTSTDPFANLPESANVDPRIRALALADFEFLQDGVLLSNDGSGTIAVNGADNLTIRLRYDKVPEILKTIAFTLTDPTDSSKVFPFLLRVNSDKTYYQSTLGPLGRSGKYAMNIVILDYQNQGLKRLHGDLQALALAAIPAVIRNGFDPLGFLLLFILLLFILLILLLLRRKNRREYAGEVPPRNLPVVPNF